jgi:hypothetical protein
MTERSFQRLNDESRERLARLVATLTPTQLSIDVGEGWTVASALAHTGFWDRWQASRWEEMLAGRWTADDAAVIEAEHLANEALQPYWIAASAAPAAEVPALALAAATRLDALIASAPDEAIAALEAGPAAYMVHRHRHRGEHIDHIERSIAAAAATVDGAFVERNAASRRRLASIVERLRVEDLSCPTEPSEEGRWTVAQILGHLAFWDRSLETRWRMAREAAGDSGPLEPTYFPVGMSEPINRPLAALLDSWTARLGLDIAAQALSAAESLDAEIEELAGRLPAGTAAVTPRVINRWIHRDQHVDQIERALTASRPGGAAAAADPGYLDRNAASLARVRDLVGRLSAADLARPVGDGTWTLGQSLGHLAFWDRFLSARWRAAIASGLGQPVGVPHEMADLLNDGLQTSWSILAAAGLESLAAEVVAAAEEVDAMIRSLPATTPLAQILAEVPALLDRSLHRVEHLEQIDRALGRQ